MESKISMRLGESTRASFRPDTRAQYLPFGLPRFHLLQAQVPHARVAQAHSGDVTARVAHKAYAAQFVLEAVSVGWLERINRIGTLVNLEPLGREHHFKRGLSFVAHVVADHCLHLSLGWLGVLNLLENVRLIPHRHRAHGGYFARSIGFQFKSGALWH